MKNVMTVFLFACITTVMQTSCRTVQMKSPKSSPSVGWNWGPVNHGLRLGLQVRDADSDIQLRLKNVSDRPITLVTQWTYERENAGYVAYAHKSTEIIFHPPLWGIPAQSGGTFRKSPQQTYKLDPGAHLQWKGKKHITDPEDLHCAGLYQVSAKLTVMSQAKEQILLYSNTEPFEMFGSDKMPKHSWTNVSSVNAEMKRASINLGSNHGIVIGDVFQLGIMGNRWRMIVSEVGNTWGSGPYTKVMGRDSMPKEPTKGDSAILRRSERFKHLKLEPKPNSSEESW